MPYISVEPDDDLRAFTCTTWNANRLANSQENNTLIQNDKKICKKFPARIILLCSFEQESESTYCQIILKIFAKYIKFINQCASEVENI